MIQEMIAILDTLRSQHEQLLSLAEAKKDALIGNDVDKLTEVTTRESRLIRLIGGTEQQRQQTTMDLLRELGLRPNARATVSDILVHVTAAADKQRLTESALKLSRVVKELKLVNERNMILVQQARAFNDFSLDLLTGGNEPDYIYENPASQGGKNKFSLYDSRV